MYHFKRDISINVLNVQIATKQCRNYLYWHWHETSVWLCSIPHSYALLRRIASSSLVCRSVCRSVMCSLSVSREKTAEAIKLPFALRTPVRPMNHVLHDVYRPTWERGNFEWETGRPLYSIGTLRSHMCKHGWTDRFGISTVDSNGRRMHKFNRIRHVAPMCPHGRTRCCHLSNNIEPSVYGGNAPYVKLLWPHVIFGHAHLDSGTDSQALRAEYCIVGIPHNTAI